MAKLPVTKARLSTSIKVWYILSEQLTAVSLQLTNQGSNVINLSVSSISSLAPRFIDGVVKFHELEDRGTDPRYEIDGKISGDVIGRILNVTEKKIQIDRTVLYKDDIVDFFEFPDELVQEEKSFAILKI